MENALPEHETYEPGEDADMIFSLAHAANQLFAGRGSGLYRSADGGRTWEFALEALGLTEPVPVTSLAVSPVFEREPRIVAGAPGGVFVSGDGGQSWKAVLFPSPPPTISALAFSPEFERDETIFAGTMEDGVFVSRSGGESWTVWNFGLLDLKILCLAVSPEFAADETIFAGTETGIFRSTNGGRAWREIELPFGFDAVLSLAFSPNYQADRTLYAGSESQGLWATTDEGESWQPLAEGIIEDPINTLLVSEGSLLAVTSSALWHSAGSGAAWTNRLPAAYAEREISSITAPHGIQPGAELLAGFDDGAVEAVKLK